MKTENEQKKEYLRSYKDHVRRVNRISEEIKELREMMMSTKAINYDGMPHGSGGQGDLSGEVARIQGLIDELKRERGLRIMTYQDIARRIKKLKVDGKEVVFERAEGDLWNTTVPLDLDGMYVVEVTAYDDAENVAFCTKILLIVEPTTLCAQLVAFDYFAEVVPEEYDAIMQNDDFQVEAVYPCHHGRGCCCE